MFDPAARRRIGRRDLFVSQLGVGTAPFGSMADGDNAVRGAFDTLYGAGLRYFDTAPFYGTGLAERRLGACMREVERSSLVISTKVGRLLVPTGPPASGSHAFEVQYDYSYDGTMRSIEHSMQRLGTNSLDIVLIHDVNRRWQGDLVEQRYKEAMAGAYKALSELRDAGAIKAFGVGVNDWSILLRIAGDGDKDGVDRAQH
jgi:D-threo-aldose 1-dehydrogenase